MLQNLHFLLTFNKVYPPHVFNMFTSKCASRHNGVHLFDILTSKKWSEPLVFLTFWLGNVLRATMACTFSTSEPPKVVRSCVFCVVWLRNVLRGVFCTFWLRNVLRATTASTFSTPQLPEVVRTCGFSEPTFQFSGARNYGKIQSFAIFLPFRVPGSSFLWDFLFLIFFLLFSSSLILTTFAYHLCLLNCRKFWLLNVLRI